VSTPTTRESAPTSRLRSRWAAVPLRARLVGILLALLIVALAVTGWGTQFVLKGYLVGQTDDRLAAAADAIDRRHGPPGKSGSPTDYYLLFTYDNGLRPVSEGPPGLYAANVPVLPVLTYAQAQDRGDEPFTARSTGSELQWRAIILPATFENGDNDEPGTVVMALPLDAVDRAVERLRLLVVVIGLLVTAACAILGWAAIRRAFAPLTDVERTAAAIAAGDLSRRVPAYPPTTEVGRLTSALNGMLAQIEAAFRARQASENRTRRFAADASHELRTPLAAIRGYAELYRQGAVREPEDVSRTMGRIEGEARRMGGLVEDLLLLARLDEQRPSRTDPVDLAVLAGDAVHDARGLAPDRTVRLVGLRPTGGPTPSVVTGDENRLRQVIANLLANAVRHTPAGSPIEVAVGSDGTAAVLEVRDHGAGITPEHAEKVFERFYRVDSSRTRGQGGGSGLGLSIVAAVVSAHSGRVGVAPTPGGGATFRVELPLAARTADEPDADQPTAPVRTRVAPAPEAPKTRRS
jgi:two-component system, OmpR family, sensor kinase